MIKKMEPKSILLLAMAEYHNRQHTITWNNRAATELTNIDQGMMGKYVFKHCAID